MLGWVLSPNIFFATTENIYSSHLAVCVKPNEKEKGEGHLYTQTVNLQQLFGR